MYYSFRDIIDYFGGPKRMAAVFDVTPARVHQWERHGTPLPRACQIEVYSERKYRHNRVLIRVKTNAKGPPSRGSSRI